MKILRNDAAWAEAKRRCRLSVHDLEMAKALGFQPKSLLKNIPSPSQPWKMPVGEWVRSLYAKKFGEAPVRAPGKSDPLAKRSST